MRPFALRMAGLVLVVLGLCESILTAYLFGRAEGQINTDTGADLAHIHSIQHRAVIGFVCGIALFVIGHAILYRNEVNIDKENQ